MSGQVTRIPHGADDDQPFPRTLLHRLRQFVRQIAFFIVSARRDVHDANVVFVAMFQHPFEAATNLLLRDATRKANLYQNKIRVRRDAAVDAIRKCATACGDN